MDADSFVLHLKTDDTSNYDLDRPLPMVKNKKVIGVMKDDLFRQIMKWIVGLPPKTYSYLKDNGDDYKKTKRKSDKRQKCVIKRNFKFQDYENCLKAYQIINIVNCSEKKGTNADSVKEDKKNHKNRVILKTQQSFKSESILLLLKKLTRSL